MFLGDFYIKEIEYDQETNLAKKFLICGGLINSLGTAFWITRDQLIEVIEDHNTVELLPENEWVHHRRIVKVVIVGAKQYLRTDGAAVEDDFFEGY